MSGPLVISYTHIQDISLEHMLSIYQGEPTDRHVIAITQCQEEPAGGQQ